MTNLAVSAKTIKGASFHERMNNLSTLHESATPAELAYALYVQDKATLGEYTGVRNNGFEFTGSDMHSAGYPLHISPGTLISFEVEGGAACIVFSDFDRDSEHIELATWNDGEVYSRDMADAPHVVTSFTGV